MSILYFEASTVVQRSYIIIVFDGVHKVSRINEGVFSRKHVNSEIETEYNYYFHNTRFGWLTAFVFLEYKFKIVKY